MEDVFKCTSFFDEVTSMILVSQFEIDNRAGRLFSFFLYSSSIIAWNGKKRKMSHSVENNGKKKGTTQTAAPDRQNVLQS